MAPSVSDVVGRGVPRGGVQHGSYKRVQRFEYMSKDYALACVDLGVRGEESARCTMVRREVFFAREVYGEELILDWDIEYGAKATILMPLYGEDMLDWLVKKPAWEERTEVYRSFLGCLMRIHDKGIIHGDVKLENAVLDGDAGVVIIDFGCARTIEDENAYCGKEFLGTLNYAAPEAMSGFSTTCGASTSSDVYSAGIMLYAVVYGGLPYEVRAREDGVGAIGFPPSKDGALEGLNRLVLSMTCRDPDKRLSVRRALSEYDAILSA